MLVYKEKLDVTLFVGHIIKNITVTCDFVDYVKATNGKTCSVELLVSVNDFLIWSAEIWVVNYGCTELIHLVHIIKKLILGVD